MAIGYKRMAKWLVPLMQDNFIVRNLVWRLIVSPLTEHGLNWRKNRKITRFWLTLWAVTGE